VAETVTMRMDRVPTPIGELLVLVDERDAVRALDWADHEARLRRLLDVHYGPGTVRPVMDPDPAGVSGRLGAYFAGDLAALAAVQVATGGTAFQRAVWTARSRAGRPYPTGRWRSASAGPRRCARSAWRTARTPSASWSRATASSATTAA
jgi:methylated-DNA-[protein]-cysteine S-methyltransferase